MAKQDLPFRGHDEQITFTNRGNYVELINLMGTLDLKLSGHLSTATIFSGLSGGIQNDLIQSIFNVLMKKITLEIINVDFVSILWTKPPMSYRNLNDQSFFDVLHMKGYRKDFWDL